MTSPVRFLLIRTGAWLCAIPVEHVQETMRPLPVRPLAGTSDFVMGVSLIRGKPAPVVAVGMLLSSASSETIGRFVTLRIDGRTVVLGVHEVLGVFDLKSAALEPLAPLVQHARPEVVEAVGALDRQLLIMLRTVRLLSEADWLAMSRLEG